MTQEAEAAAMKMFGNLTRTVKPFYPNRIVCKRFNVRNPHPNHDPTADADVGRTQAGNKDALSKESMESLLNERLPLKFTSTNNEPKPDDSTMKAVIPKPSERAADESAPTTGVDKEVIKEEEEGPELDYERPSMDIFKAIFDDSDEEDEEEEEEESKHIQETQVVEEEDTLIGPPAPPPIATIDIPIERKTTESSEPFRPMFKRASERKEQTVPLTNIVSEEFVVQPFKPRTSAHKRRHVSVSDEEDVDDRSRHHKSSSKHKSSKSSRRRSKSRDRHVSRDDRSSREKRHKSSRDDTRDEEKRHRSSRKRSRSPGKHKSNRKRSPDERKHKNRKDRSSDNRSIKFEEDYEGFWVEKEPVIHASTSSKKKEGRKSAADMW